MRPVKTRLHGARKRLKAARNLAATFRQAAFSTLPPIWGGGGCARCVTSLMRPTGEGGGGGGHGGGVCERGGIEMRDAGTFSLLSCLWQDDGGKCDSRVRTEDPGTWGYTGVGTAICWLSEGSNTVSPHEPWLSGISTYTLNPNMSNTHSQSQVHPCGHHCQWSAMTMRRTSHWLSLGSRQVSRAPCCWQSFNSIHATLQSSLTRCLRTGWCVCPRWSCLADHKGPRCWLMWVPHTQYYKQTATLTRHYREHRCWWRS